MKPDTLDECIGYIDMPSGQSPTLCGTAWVEGWLVSPNGPLDGIELVVDGRTLPLAVSRKPRPDVVAVVAKEIGEGEATGFAVAVELAQFSSGEHRLEVVGRRGADRRAIVSQAFRVEHGLRAFLGGRILGGSGLEIGALHSPQAVPGGCRVRYVDRLDVEGLRAHYPELNELPLVPVDIIDDGETLATIAEGSQDFIIAHHFLEHTQDPIGTIARHLDVLRPGGVLFMAVPDKRETFDVDRPRDDAGSPLPRLSRGAGVVLLGPRPRGRGTRGELPRRISGHPAAGSSRPRGRGSRGELLRRPPRREGPGDRRHPVQHPLPRLDAERG